MRTILHTIETGGPGGAETVLLEIATRLDPSQYRSVVVLSRDGWLREQLLARGIKTILVDWKAWHDFRLPRALANVVRWDNVDLIHSHLPDHNFYSSLVGRWTNRPTIATYHGAVELTRQIRARDAFKRWVVRKTASTVVVVCDHVGRMLKEAGFPPEKIVRIYNGIQTPGLSGSPSRRLREELGCGQDSMLVGMVANIRQSKGYEYFIPAARIVVNSHPNVMFVAVGDDHERIGLGLRAMVSELGLQNHFRFLGFRSDVPAILRELDVFVLSSTSEGFPLVVLEAMAACRPVVVTRCGGPEEMVEDGKDGFLVPPADARALALRISELLHNPDLRVGLGTNGQGKVARKFSLEKMLNDYTDLYDLHLRDSLTT